MKSPLKDKPLPNPGESLDRQIDDVIYDEVVTYYVLALVVVLLAIMEWWKWYSGAPPSPGGFALCAFGFLIYSGFRVLRARKKVKSLKLGRDGERAVGQFLERLREDGAKIFHDFPGEKFNLDHIIVHSSGVYAIETKTYSKPDRGKAIVVYNGKSITSHGRIPEEGPIVQSKAAAGWLSEIIKESTGRRVPVRPVVVFPGWYVQSTAEAKSSDVWVLNPKALPAFIANSQAQLEPEDQRLVSYHLSRYLRTA